MTHCVLLLHTVSKKKSWSYSVGLQEGGEAEPSIFSWLKGTFQFDWKIFLYFGWGKYDAFGKSWNLNLMIFNICSFLKPHIMKVGGSVYLLQNGCSWSQELKLDFITYLPTILRLLGALEDIWRPFESCFFGLSKLNYGL